MINAQQPLMLQDSRVLLKAMQLSDFYYLLPFAVNEPELWKYSVIQPIGAVGMANYVQSAVSALELGNEFPFVIWDKTRQTCIGSSRLFDVNMHTKCAQIGYTWYGAEYQGKAINKHSKYLLLQWAFEEMGFERIECRVDSENHRSIRSLTSIGYKQDGILRSNGLRPDGSRRDSIVFSILKSEWYLEIKSRLHAIICNPSVIEFYIHMDISNDATFEHSSPFSYLPPQVLSNGFESMQEIA
jgi:RimJ/RimL family protein N-acetyltransferase